MGVLGSKNKFPMKVRLRLVTEEFKGDRRAFVRVFGGSLNFVYGGCRALIGIS